MFMPAHDPDQACTCLLCLLTVVAGGLELADAGLLSILNCKLAQPCLVTLVPQMTCEAGVFIDI